MPGLTLTRKPGEKIYTDGPCVFTVQEISGKLARINIVAEPHVGIKRGEHVADSRAERDAVDRTEKD